MQVTQTLKSPIQQRKKSKYHGTTTVRSYNPWMGCFKVSDGCAKAYL